MADARGGRPQVVKSPRSASADAAAAPSSPRSGSRSYHCLEFDSWWNEGKVRRFVYIRYNIAKGAFQMAIDDDCNLYHVPVAYRAKTAEVATVWDLRVGAELDILGRITTLQRCSLTTAQWNKHWGDLLIALRERLITELRKYESKRKEQWLTYQRHSVEAGSIDIRLLMGQVAGLGTQLRQYRPKLADQLALPKEMFDIELLPAQSGDSQKSAAEAPQADQTGQSAE